MLIPYEQLFTQTFHHNGNLIKEQGTGEQNPLFQLASCLRQQLHQNKNRSVRHPQHTQTSSNSSMIAADSNNGYVHHSLFNRPYCIFRRNKLSTTIVILI